VAKTTTMTTKVVMVALMMVNEVVAVQGLVEVDRRRGSSGGRVTC
jgi:hypothetical protein